jgi:four helix bundle protein
VNTGSGSAASVEGGNIQPSTLNPHVNAIKYDLEERLMEFAVRVIRLPESVGRTRAGMYVADQLLRAGTSPYRHHGEAEGAESRDDFIHKLKVCYEELRETRRWLHIVQLVRIFSASIRTTQQNPPVKVRAAKLNGKSENGGALER